jgi:hypothetical protein
LDPGANALLGGGAPVQAHWRCHSSLGRLLSADSRHATHPSLKLAAALLTVHAVTLLGAYLVLAAVLDLPAVLRRPTTEIVALFQRSESVIVPTYYAFTLTGINFIVIALAMREALRERDSSWSRAAGTFGVLAGITQAVGFVRWVWLVPSLAAVIRDPTSSVATRDSALLVFEAMHQFAGVSIGENLSFLFQGLWTLSVSIAMLHHPRFDRRVGLAGIASGASFVVYTLEQFGGPFSALGDLNVEFHCVWLAWMVVTASMLLRTNAHVDPTEGHVRVGWRSTAAAFAGTAALLAVVFAGG